MTPDAVSVLRGHDGPMTTDDTHTQPSPPPGAYPPIATLRRSRADRHLAGVAGGLGRYAGVDPLIFRILFVVLAFFGGSGILLYALGWLLIPQEGESQSNGQQLLHGRRDGSTVSTLVTGVVVLVLGLVFMGNFLDTGPGLGGLGALIVVGLVVVLLLNRGQRPATDQAPHTPAYGPAPPPEPGAYGQTAGTAYATTAPVQGPPPPPSYPTSTQPLPPVPPEPKEKSVLGRVTSFTALIVVGLMVGWNSVSDNDFKVVAIFGTALAVVAAGLLVGAFVGRARGLIVLGILLSIATSISAVADHHFPGGVGERDWAPTSVAAAEEPFRLGAGEAQLDLTALPAGSSADVEARVGLGELRIIVPPDASVVVNGEVGAGAIRILGEPTFDGTDLTRTYTLEPLSGDPASGTRITVDAEVGLGELEVRR